VCRLDLSRGKYTLSLPHGASKRTQDQHLIIRLCRTTHSRHGAWTSEPTAKFMPFPKHIFILINRYLMITLSNRSHHIAIIF